MQQENHAGVIEHPAFLHDCTKLDTAAYPYLALLYSGDPANGWEGDDRLCMYSGPESRYHLFRLEWDGQYRLVCRSKPFGIGMMGPEGVQKLIRELIAKDSRRGVNVGEAAIAHNEAIDRDRDDQFNSLIDEEVAPRLAYWASHAYLPGLDIAPRMR